MIQPGGTVETVAGSGLRGFADGNEIQALFNAPGGIALGIDGSLIVADTGNNRIRRINLNPAAPAPATPTLRGELLFGLTLFGQKGQVFRIESAEKSAPANWVALTNVALTGTVQKWVDPRPASGNRIYRAVLAAP